MEQKEKYITLEEFNELIEELYKKVKGKTIFGVPKNGCIIALALSKKGCKITDNLENAEVIVDDLIDSGKTMKKYEKYNKPFLALIDKRKMKDKRWIKWWFEDKQNDIQESVTRILECINENPNREGLEGTPARVERLFNNFFYGYIKKLKIMNETERQNNKDENIIPITIFNTDCDELLIRNTKFISFCEHHIVPFYGVAYVGIIPNKKLLGMNKIDKIVKYFAARLQIQERLTNQIADWIDRNLKPKGVIVVIRANHLCAELQGDKGDFTTSAIRGIFKTKFEARTEFLSLIK